MLFVYLVYDGNHGVEAIKRVQRLAQVEGKFSKNEAEREGNHASSLVRILLRVPFIVEVYFFEVAEGRSLAFHCVELFQIDQKRDSNMPYLFLQKGKW